jgi:hypothetical protein
MIAVLPCVLAIGFNVLDPEGLVVVGRDFLGCFVLAFMSPCVKRFPRVEPDQPDLLAIVRDVGLGRDESGHLAKDGRELVGDLRLRFLHPWFDNRVAEDADHHRRHPLPEQAVRLEDKGSIGPEVAPDLLGEPDRLCSVVLAS